jgi:hypothetical protein
VHVEVVKQSEELEELGGIGCLLRYRIDAPVAETKVGAA